MNYVKFYPGLAKAIDERLKHEYLYDEDVKDGLEKILTGFSRKDNCVLNANVLEFFKKVIDFDIEKYIYCMLGGNDLNNLTTYVKLKSTFFDFVDKEKLRLSENDFKKVETDLTRRQINLLPLLNFRRIEYIIGIQLGEFVEKRYIPIENIVEELKIGEKEKGEKMYQALRILSTKYNFGYRFCQETKNFFLEKQNKKELEFYYGSGSIYFGKKEICDFYFETSIIAKKINNFYERMIRKEQENN